MLLVLPVLVPWGYLLAGVLLVKAAPIGLWVVAMIWFGAGRGIATPAAYTGFFIALTAVGAALAWRFLARRSVASSR